LRKKKNELYLEGKFLTGYFDFSELFYSKHLDWGEYFSENFWTYGGALALGYSFGMKKSDNAIVNLSAGFQYLPMNVPETKDNGNLEVANDWWYFYGPGSYFEIKITLGGIF